MRWLFLPTGVVALLFGPDRPFWFGIHRSWRVWAATILFAFIGFLPLILSEAQIRTGGVGFDWLRGSSTFGILCGAIGGYLIAFEMLLWIRKRFRGFASNHISGASWPIAFVASIPALALGLFLWVQSMLSSTINQRTERTRAACWRQARNGWWPIVFVLMFLFQFPLYIFYFFWRQSAPKRAEAKIRMLMAKYKYRTVEDIGKEANEATRKAFAEEKTAAIESERDKVRWFYLSTQIWMWGHVWFGFISFALVIAHSGYRLGGPLTQILSILFIITIISGAWGLFLQNRLPKLLRDEVLEETVASQIEWVLERRIPEAGRLLKEITGRSPPEVADIDSESERKQYLERISPELNKEMSNPRLREMYLFYVNDVLPYLLDGNQSRSTIKSGDKAKVLFERFRSNLVEKNHAALTEIEQICAYRRQLEDQDRINRWLHGWISCHLPISAAMFLLMIVHVLVALRYW